MFVHGSTIILAPGIGAASYQALSKNTATPSPRRFAKCILHIGTEKTATTSLQTFMSLNHQGLLARGCYVPKSIALSPDYSYLNHVYLASFALKDSRLDKDLRGDLGVNNPDDMPHYRTRLIERLDAELRNVPLNCDTLLLSNEHLHSRIQTLEEILCLKSWLDRYCDHYEIIVYLRPQHELAMSYYGMLLLHGLYKVAMFPDFKNAANDGTIEVNEQYFNYDILLKNWTCAFGRAAIFPRIFGKSEFYGGNIIDDFCRGMFSTQGLQQPGRENTNISAAAQYFLLKLYPRLEAKGVNLQGLACQELQNRLQHNHPGKGILPTIRDVKKFLQQFAESNEAVRATWFPGRTELFPVNEEVYLKEPVEAVFEVEGLFDIFSDAFAAGITPDNFLDG